MKVCLICPHFPIMSYPCGAADFTLGLAKSLSQTNQVQVVTANDKTVFVNGVEIHTIPGPWNIFRVLKISRLIREQSFDVVDIQFEAYMYGRRGAILLLPLLLPRKIKKILTLHSEALPTTGGKIWRYVQMKLFDQVIFYSEQFMKNAQVRFNGYVNKFSLSPFPANIARYPDTTLKSLIARHFKGQAGHKLHLSYFGHISQERGIEYLIDLMDRLKGQDVHLIFIGQFDPSKNTYHRDIHSLIKARELESSITFTGRLDEKEVSQIISTSDAGVLPFLEGASFKNGSLAAYAAHHVPVLTTQSHLTEEVLKNNKGLHFFDLSSVSSLETKILELLVDSQLLVKSRSAIAELEGLYSWENYSQQRQSIYQKHIHD